MDGEWEAPQIPNAKCETAPGCGEWVRPMKSNPKYKGKWRAPMIDNPNYQVIVKLLAEQASQSNIFILAFLQCVYILELV